MNLPDAERLAVAWAKADAPLAALLAGRVATRLPNAWTSPFLRVVQLDGDRDVEAPVGSAFLQWDAFARDLDFTSASAVIRTLIGQAMNVNGLIVATGNLYGFSAVSGPRRFEEEETGFARFQVDMFLTIRELVGGA